MTRFLALLFLLWLTPAATAQLTRPIAGHLQEHVVQEGEDLVSIALHYRLAVDHLAYANGFPITTIKASPGAKLIVPTERVLPKNPPANGLVVNLPERGAYLFKNGGFVRFYPISIGDEVEQKGRFQTPTGQFRIIERVKNPTWYPPSWSDIKRPVGPGKDNPLGDRWIGLSLTRTGIHGTNDPYNIGNSVTHGCMRTYPTLIRELFEEVRVGWPVRIEYEPAKLGRDASGNLYLVTFPDIYKKKNTVTFAKNLLNKAGRSQSLARHNFDDIIKLTLGVPVSLDDGRTVLEEIKARTP